MAEMSRDNARKIELQHGITLEECVNALLEFKNRGESVVVDLEGHKLYSCDVTLDNDYVEVFGKTKSEYDKALEEYDKNHIKQQEKNKAEAEAKIPEWIKKGEAFIYPERAEKWKKYVEIHAMDLHYGIDLDSTLEIMEKLERGASMEEVKEIFDRQNLAGHSREMVRSMMFHFAKKGPEFYESTAWRELSDEEKKAITDKKRENAELDELHRDQSTKIVSSERKKEEQEITDSSAEKEQLISEISEIEQKLADLRAKKAKLEESLNAKINELDENN